MGRSASEARGPTQVLARTVVAAAIGVLAGGLTLAGTSMAAPYDPATTSSQAQARPDVSSLTDEQLVRELAAEVAGRKLAGPQGPIAPPQAEGPWGPRSGVPNMVPGGNPFPQQRMPSERELSIRGELTARGLPVPDHLNDPRDMWSGAEGEIPVSKLFGLSLRYAYNEFTGKMQLGFGVYTGQQGIPGRAGDLANKQDGVHFAGRLEFGYEISNMPVGPSYDARGTGWVEFFGEGTYNPRTGAITMMGQLASKSPTGQAGAINGSMTYDPKTGEWSFNPADGWSQQMVGKGGGGVRTDAEGDKQQVMIPPNKHPDAPKGFKFKGKIPFSIEGQGRIQGTYTFDMSKEALDAVKKAEELGRQLSQGAQDAWDGYERTYNETVDRLRDMFGVDRAREMLGLPPLRPQADAPPEPEKARKEPPAKDPDGFESPGTGDGDAQDRDREREQERQRQQGNGGGGGDNNPARGSGGSGESSPDGRSSPGESSSGGAASGTGSPAGGSQAPSGQAPSGSDQAPSGQAPSGSDQAPSGQAPSGSDQAPSDQAPSGQAPSGEAPSGEAPSGEAPPGESPSDQAPSGQAPPGETPSDQAPSGQAPTAPGGMPSESDIQRAAPPGTIVDFGDPTFDVDTFAPDDSLPPGDLNIPVAENEQSEQDVADLGTDPDISAVDVAGTENTSGYGDPDDTDADADAADASADVSASDDSDAVSSDADSSEASSDVSSSDADSSAADSSSDSTSSDGTDSSESDAADSGYGGDSADSGYGGDSGDSGVWR
jgi:hypothetical protein